MFGFLDPIMIPIKFHFDCYTQTIINLSHISINDAILENWRVWQVGLLYFGYTTSKQGINPRNVAPTSAASALALASGLSKINRNFCFNFWKPKRPAFRGWIPGGSVVSKVPSPWIPALWLRPDIQSQSPILTKNKLFSQTNTSVTKKHKLNLIHTKVSPTKAVASPTQLSLGTASGIIFLAVLDMSHRFDGFTPWAKIDEILQILNGSHRHLTARFDILEAWTSISKPFHHQSMFLIFTSSLEDEALDSCNFLQSKSKH